MKILNLIFSAHLYKNRIVHIVNIIVIYCGIIDTKTKNTKDNNVIYWMLCFFVSLNGNKFIILKK